MKKVFLLVAAFVTLTYSYKINTAGHDGLTQSISAYTMGYGSFNTGLSVRMAYANEGIYYNGESKSPLLLDEDLFFAIGVADWADVSINLPIYSDFIDGMEDDVVGIGDLSTAIKLLHPGLKDDAPLRVAYLLRISAPTGSMKKGYFPRSPVYGSRENENVYSPYTSTGLNLNPMLLWTLDGTRFTNPLNFKVHANFGGDMLFETTRKKNDPQHFFAFIINLGYEYLISDKWSVFSEFYGMSRMDNLNRGVSAKLFNADQFALSFGGTYKHDNGMYSTVGLDLSLEDYKNDLSWETERDGNNYAYTSQSAHSIGLTWTLGFAVQGDEADSDFDGNPATTDECPDKAEDYDGYQDEDGCPDMVHVQDTITIVEVDTMIVVEKDTIKVIMKQEASKIIEWGQTTFPSITFKTGKAILKPTGFKILNDIARSLNNFPEVKLEITGYTDNTGSKTKNLILSRQRADAVVKYLYKKGVNKNRLKAIGKGVLNPIDDNKTLEGRVLNRRVEFSRIK